MRVDCTNIISLHSHKIENIICVYAFKLRIFKWNQNTFWGDEFVKIVNLSSEKEFNDKETNVTNAFFPER